MKYILSLLFFVGMIFTCPDQDQRCGSCMGSTCIFCYDGFLNSGVCQEPSTRVENCMTYSSATQCQQCVFGYTLNNNACEKITLDKCLRQNSQNQCIVCSDGILVNQGQCNSDNKCSVENCSVCGWDGSNEICVKCKSGYSIYPKDKASQCTTDGQTKGCLSLNFSDQQQCSMCHPHYYYNSGSCSSTGLQQVNMESIGVLRLAITSFMIIYGILF